MTGEVDPGGVDRGGGDQLVGRDPQVGGREPELPAPLGAVLDRRPKEVVASEQLRGGPHLAEQHQAPNPGAADRRSTAGQRRNHLDAEAVAGAKPAEESRVTAPAVAEAMVLADDEPAELHPAQQPLHERRRAQGGQLRREGDHHQVVQAELFQEPGLFIEGGEIGRAMVRVEHAPRVRFEGHQDTGGARLLGPGDQGLQQRQVTPMDAIEGPHGGVGRPQQPRCGEAETDRGHEEKTARGCRR